MEMKREVLLGIRELINFSKKTRAIRCSIPRTSIFKFPFIVLASKMTQAGRSTSTGCSVANPCNIGLPCSSTVNVCDVPETETMKIPATIIL